MAAIPIASKTCFVSRVATQNERQHMQRQGIHVETMARKRTAGRDMHQIVSIVRVSGGANRRKRSLGRSW